MDNYTIKHNKEKTEWWAEFSNNKKTWSFTTERELLDILEVGINEGDLIKIKEN